MIQNNFIIKSNAFANYQEIPKQHTCEGKNISPSLSWSGVPEGTKSLALIVEDPDAPDPKAPQTIFTHWIVYNIPATANAIAEGAIDKSSEVRFGVNDWKHAYWQGPCPPIGQHRYFYKLYALDTMLSFANSPNKSQLEKAMTEHILGTTEIVGVYQKTN